VRVKGTKTLAKTKGEEKPTFILLQVFTHTMYKAEPNLRSKQSHFFILICFLFNQPSFWLLISFSI